MTDEDNERANQEGEEIVKFQGVLHFTTSLYSVNNDVEIKEMKTILKQKLMVPCVFIQRVETCVTGICKNNHL